MYTVFFFFFTSYQTVAFDMVIRGMRVGRKKHGTKNETEKRGGGDGGRMQRRNGWGGFGSTSRLMVNLFSWEIPGNLSVNHLISICSLKDPLIRSNIFFRMSICTQCKWFKLDLSRWLILFATTPFICLQKPAKTQPYWQFRLKRVIDFQFCVISPLGSFYHQCGDFVSISCRL